MYTLLNPCDQIEFPNTALELPGAQRHERNKEQNRKRARHGQEERRVTTAPGTAVSAVASASTVASAPIAASVAAAASVLTAANATTGTSTPTAGVTTRHRVGVRGLHGMLGMFRIDPGIIL